MLLMRLRMLELVDLGMPPLTLPSGLGRCGPVFGSFELNKAEDLLWRRGVAEGLMKGGSVVREKGWRESWRMSASVWVSTVSLGVGFGD